MLVSPPSLPCLWAAQFFCGTQHHTHRGELVAGSFPGTQHCPALPAQAIWSKTLQLRGGDKKRRCVARCPALPAALILIRSVPKLFFK